MMTKALFFLLLLLSCFVSPVVALFMGMVFAVVFRTPCGKTSRFVSKYLLQAAVVGLGFGMNIHEALAAGKEGIVFTIVSVAGVMVVGCLLGRWMGIAPKTSYLISSGTAICGGSAIAAVAPVVKADENETTVSLAVIFTLNAIALFIFPPFGRLLGLNEHQFGLWAAIAIHDTSSVVGAASVYGEEALKIATTVKLTRALWIIPLSLVSVLFFLRSRQRSQRASISIPWFIVFFILAMLINSCVSIPPLLAELISTASRKALSITLYLIGSGLSVTAIRQQGLRPVMLGVSLWLIISVATLLVIR